MIVLLGGVRIFFLLRRHVEITFILHSSNGYEYAAYSTVSGVC